MLQATIIMLAVMTAGFLLIEGVASAGVRPVITTEYLAKNLADPDLLIIDTRTEADYGLGHVPGAVNIPYEEWHLHSEEDDCFLVTEEADLVELLRKKGLNNNSRVVVYDHGKIFSDVTRGGFVYWVLRSRGHENVSYLNGGFSKWTFEGRMIDNKRPVMKTGDFSAGKTAKARVIGFEQLQEAVEAGDAVLVDCRSSEQHFGASKRADISQFGHIPGSLSLPATFFSNAGSDRAPVTIKNKEELSRVVKGVGLPADKDQELIVYCNIGQWAGMVCLVLKDILEYGNVSLYDGSLYEYVWKSFEPLARYSWGHVQH
ncbi:MAG: sulfurtransferase [Thermodesulfobacteriota bacterium]